MENHLGQGYPKKESENAFDRDVQSVLRDCKLLYKDFDELPEEVQQIVANMMFNMGYGRLSKFKGMLMQKIGTRLQMR